MQWYLYIVRCADNSLYTGISPDVEERIKKHNLGQGSKYVRSRLPVQLVHKELYNSQIEAAARERKIKLWERKYKLRLVETGKDPEV